MHTIRDDMVYLRALKSGREGLRGVKSKKIAVIQEEMC